MKDRSHLVGPAVMYLEFYNSVPTFWIVRYVCHAPINTSCLLTYLPTYSKTQFSEFTYVYQLNMSFE